MTTEEGFALVLRQAQAWQEQDVETILADFATDSVFISPGGQWHGHAALRQAIQDFFAGACDITVQVTRVLCDGDGGAAEWTWGETRLTDGKRYLADDAIIFTLQQGKITYWREYIHWQ